MEASAKRSDESIPLFDSIKSHADSNFIDTVEGLNMNKIIVQVCLLVQVISVTFI